MMPANTFNLCAFWQDGNESGGALYTITVNRAVPDILNYVRESVINILTDDSLPESRSLALCDIVEDYGANWGDIFDNITGDEWSAYGITVTAITFDGVTDLDSTVIDSDDIIG